MQGQLVVVAGCMFSGKTTRLIERLAAAADEGCPVHAFKHSLDDRYDRVQLATHDGRRWQADTVRTADEIAARVSRPAVIGIDEGQFFTAGLPEVCRELRAAGCVVYVAGIDHNAWGAGFEPMPTLMRIADHVEILTVPCTVCGAAARYSQRMKPVTTREMVGGPGEYEPRCERCFEALPGGPPGTP